MYFHFLPSYRRAVVPSCRRTAPSYRVPSYRRTVVPSTVVPSNRRTSLPRTVNRRTFVPSTVVPSYRRTVDLHCRRTFVPSYRRTFEQIVPSYRRNFEPSYRHCRRTFEPSYRRTFVPCTFVSGSYVSSFSIKVQASGIFKQFIILSALEGFGLYNLSNPFPIAFWAVGISLWIRLSPKLP